MIKKYISWAQLEGHCLHIVSQMWQDNWIPEIIVGVTRGGAVPAVMLSHFMQCKMVGLDVSLRDSDNGPESNCWLAEDAANGKRILIVDDINDSGATIDWIVNDWDYAGDSIKWGENVRVATIIDNTSSKAKVTPSYCGEEINKAVDDVWVVFPYEEFWKRNET